MWFSIWSAEWFSSAHTQAYIYLNHILYILISLKNRLVIKVSPQSWDEKSFISNSSSDSGFPWGTFRETEYLDRAPPIAQLVKNLPAMQETQVRFLGQEDPLEKKMAIHSFLWCSYETLSSFIGLCHIGAKWDIA